MQYMRGLLFGSKTFDDDHPMLLLPIFDSYDGSSAMFGDRIRVEFAFSKGQTEKKVKLTTGGWVNLATMETYRGD